MNTFNLKLTGSYLGNAIVLVDGKPIQLKKNKFANLAASCQTEKQSVILEIYRALDVGGALWFLAQLFFFVISVFGLFDVRNRRKHVGLVYRAEICLQQESSMILRCNLPVACAKAFEIDTELTVREESNLFFVDARAKKTFKILLVSKIVLAVAIVGCVAAWLITKF